MNMEEKARASLRGMEPGARFVCFISENGFTAFSRQKYEKTPKKYDKIFSGYSILFYTISASGEPVEDSAEIAEKKKITPVEKLCREWLKEDVSEGRPVPAIGAYICHTSGSACIYAPELDALTVAADVARDIYIKNCKKYGYTPQDFLPRIVSRFSSSDALRRIFDAAPAADLIPAADLAKLAKIADYIHISQNRYISVKFLSKIAGAMKITRAAVARDMLFVWDNCGRAAVIMCAVNRSGIPGAVELSDVFAPAEAAENGAGEAEKEAAAQTAPEEVRPAEAAQTAENAEADADGAAAADPAATAAGDEADRPGEDAPPGTPANQAPAAPFQTTDKTPESPKAPFCAPSAPFCGLSAGRSPPPTKKPARKTHTPRTGTGGKQNEQNTGRRYNTPFCEKNQYFIGESKK